MNEDTSSTYELRQSCPACSARKQAKWKGQVDMIWHDDETSMVMKPVVSSLAGTVPRCPSPPWAVTNRPPDISHDMSIHRSCHPSIHASTSKKNISASMCASQYVGTRIYIQIHTIKYIHIYTNRILITLYTAMCTCRRAHTYMHMPAHTHKHIHTYVPTPIYLPTLT